jgi:hypothetical protein
MLNRLSDFYRIVNLEPSDALITQRKEAIISFLEQLSNRELQYACADIAAFGLGSQPNSKQQETARLMITAIQGPQPSFSSDVSANPLDLRVFAGVSIGEHISRHADMIPASLVISALATCALPEERYLAEFVTALLSVAQDCVETKAKSLRERAAFELPAIQGADAPTLAKSVKGALGTLQGAVEQNLRADREELDILWWVFGGYSSKTGKQFSALDLSQRALASAAELADLVMAPPITGSQQFLNAVLKEDGLLNLRQLIDPCSTALLESITTRRISNSEILSSHPALLPLSWLSCRKLDSGMSTGWEAEFELKTHVSVTDKRMASKWATQIFNECVATRLIAESVVTG